VNEKTKWWPTAELATLQLRAKLLNQIRTFFLERDVLEVETPIFTQSGSTEVHLDQFVTQVDQSHQSFSLNTSAELAMKRLLAAGYGDIYQISKVFRANELGSRHEPEFSMLEWYRVGFTMNDLLKEVDDLLTSVLGKHLKQTSEVKSYQQTFLEILELDPLDVSVDELKAIYKQQKGYDAPELDEKQAYLGLIMSELIEPEFAKDRLTFITHYPAEQASLARINKSDHRVAERFEVFAGGLELGNGFYELKDVEEQKRRMCEENLRRTQLGKPEVKPDPLFCAALEHGLPDCSGIAIGIDRLVMLEANKNSIQDVKSFSTSNA